MSVAQLDVALDRPLPQSPDAERAVLGSILINNHAFYRVVSTINTEDFFRDAPGVPADVLNNAEKSIYEIAEGSIEKGFVALDRITRSNMTAIEQLQHAGKLITGIPTGYDRFNEFTSGFQAQDLIIIAARP